MSDVLIAADALREELGGTAAPIVLDATVLLPRPRHDGDHRVASGRERWAGAHIPGSLHADLVHDFSDPDAGTHFAHPEPQRIADSLARLGVAADRPVVVYDTGGSLWAARLWWLSTWIGAPARVLDGGLDEWRRAGGAVATGEAAPTPVAPWPATARFDAWADLDEVIQLSGSRDHPILVCGLGEAQFRGDEPTRYSRRGHIPASVNVPARDLFDHEGGLRPAEEVRRAHLAAGADPASGLVLYCGGGISAAAGALALAAIGAPRPRIYDGSLEEWTARAELPLHRAG